MGKFKRILEDEDHKSEKTPQSCRSSRLRKPQTKGLTKLDHSNLLNLNQKYNKPPI